MNQIKDIIELRQYTVDDHPFGNVQGKDVFRKLTDYIDSRPRVTIFEISLVDIEATDASFPRESIISIAKQYRGDKGFYLTAIKNRDLVDNWNYAAIAKQQPLTVWNERDFEILGPKLSQSNHELMEFILSEGKVTTSQIASKFSISIPNSSTRLKRLVSQGYILRAEEAAQSGGVEFIYKAIK